MPTITQTLLDARRAAMANDSVKGPARFSAQRSSTDVCAERVLEQPAKTGQDGSENKAPEAERRAFSKPLEAMAKKVTAFEQSESGFNMAPEQLSACRWFGEAMDVALQEAEKKG